MTLRMFRTVVVAWALALRMAGAAPAGETQVEEFVVNTPGGPLRVVVESPAAGRLAAAPLLLLNFSMDRQASLSGGRFGEPARTFLAAGHRAASFDLPAHGQRIDRHGSGIDGLRNAVLAGDAPFDRFVADGRAVIDALLERGLARAGGIVACGVSRAGYCVLRLAAADARIAAVAALAPVTDWRVVREFAGVNGHPAVAALELTSMAPALAGRRVYVAIGNADRRVDTNTCTRFVLAIGEVETQRGLAESRLRYVVADDSAGHALGTRWRREGVAFLLGHAGKAEVAPALP